MEDTKELFENNTVFDDVFRTMLERIPEIMIPLINEVFSTNYPEDEPITQLKNEHFTKSGVSITDCVLGIREKHYHLECQSNPDRTIALRIIEHDMALALQTVKEVTLLEGSEHDYEMSFPLLEELSDIRFRLERTVGEEKGLIYAELISHIKKIDDHIFRNQPETRKRMEEITMGGQVYETLTDQAVKRGIFQSVMRLSDTGDYTEEEACAVLGAEYPAYLLYKEQLLATQSTK